MSEPLPLTVIGGYLGAGKTTLINRLLTEDHGKRLMIMVNDFGAVNIDASLLTSSSDDTMELTNGCVCCTMGADLFLAVGDVLDRANRPDHLIIEASGIADPAKIAEVSRAEPDLSYAGILTVVDGAAIADILQDPLIAPQIEGQIMVADLLLVSKAEPDEALLAVLGRLNPVPPVPANTDLGPILWDLGGEVPEPVAAHGHYVKWSISGGPRMGRDDLLAKLKARPAGLYRLKGFVAHPGGGFQVQVVGKSVEVVPWQDIRETTLVGIGLAGRMAKADVDAWWAAT